MKKEKTLSPTQNEIEIAATKNAKNYYGHRDEDMERGFENGVKWLSEKLKTLSPTLKENIIKILYNNSHDDSECLRIKFENVDKVVDLLSKCLSK